MKILITTDWYTPAVNGVVTSVLNLVRQLEERGHEVRVLTLAQDGGGKKWLLHGFRKGNVWYLPSMGVGKIYPGARAALTSGREYLEELAGWKPDVVHSQCEFTTFWYARWIVKHTGALFLHTYHTVYEDYTHYFSPSRSMGKRAAAIFSRMVVNQTDGVIAPTEKVSRMLEEYGIYPPVYTVPSGIDCRRFRQAAERADPAGRTSLVMVGRLAREKNTGEILSWLAGPRGRAYTCTIVGGGPERGNLERQAKELGLEGRVSFTGMIPPGQIADWYQKGRVFVSASQSETQGLTYLEALAGGIPAVCRKDPCLDGVIIDGENGWQYTDEEEFFDALEKLENRDTYRRMAARAEIMAERFDSARFGEKILEVYGTCRRKERMKWTKPYQSPGRLSG